MALAPRIYPIDRWIVFIAGFLQHDGRVTGIVEAWLRTHIAYSAPHTRCELRAWSDSMSAQAELIHRLRPYGFRPVVIIVGYSWGGASALNLARELRDRGLDVAAIVLSDAVYRHHYWLGQWRAFVPWSQLTVPDSVANVHRFRQREDLPSGHEIVAEDKNKTTIHPDMIAHTRHEWMDDLWEFHAKIDEVAEQYLAAA